MAHLLHIDLLEECGDIDTLDKFHNNTLQLFIILLVLLVLLDSGSIVYSKFLLLLDESFLLALEL